MGFFKRLRRIIRSNLEHVLDKSEKPEQLLDQIIVEMQQQLLEAKKRVASAIVDERKMERHIRESRLESEKWNRRAILAVQSGKDDLAKSALSNKLKLDRDRAEYEAQLHSQHEAVEKLKEALRGLQQKLEDAKRRHNLLAARARQAEAQRQIQKTITGMSDTSAFAAFEKMEDKIERIESENEAYEEIEAESTPEDIERQYAELEGASKNVDNLLAELKQKMALEGSTPERTGDDSTSTETDVDESLENLKRSLQEEESLP